MILFDTDTLTHFAYGNENVLRKIEKVGEEKLAISIITRYEILRGRAENLLKAANKEELRKATERFRSAEELLAAFVIVDFNKQSIDLFERLRK